MPTIHISPYAGSWYPSSPADLERLLDEKFEESLRRTGPYLLPDALGLVTPHAGPMYSGTVAAAVYRTLHQQRPERVVVLAFPHRGGLRGVACPDIEAVSTPLGEVAVDGAIDGFARVAERQVCDHSFEIQLPFLQRAAPGARITPLYVGGMNQAERCAAAEVLAAAWRPGVVFVASSDFTHYGPSFGFVPFPDRYDTEERLRELDLECMDGAGSLDPALFLETLAANGATVCGTAPIALLLEVLRRLGAGDIYQSTLDYQTSGELTGEFRDSVSYAALGYYRKASFDLNAADREALLDSAVETLRQLRETGLRRPVPPRHGSPALDARRGSFVSLHQGEKLLGCVGNCTGRDPLAEEVPHLALAASLEDPRFRPATEVEGPIDVEVSVLTPFRRIRRAGEFSIGRHGGYLSLGGRAGLLLPQVARERDWSAEEFLEALARKSMLGPHAWRDPQARLHVFEAQVFARVGRTAP